MSLRKPGYRLFIFTIVFGFVLSGCGGNKFPPAENLLGQLSKTPEPSPTVTETPTATPVPSFPDSSAYNWSLVVDGFQRPLLLTNAGDGSGRLFVVGQDGQIRIIENGSVLAEPFLDIAEKITSQGNEQGLLGLAFHPDYKKNGLFYVNYTDVNGDTVVSRFHVSSDPNRADVGSEEILLQVNQPYPNHNGGNLVFGPDGMLYIGLGDGGSQGDPNGNGQSLDTLLGKILRIDVNSGAPYSVPGDNPFAQGGGLPEIWAYGLRNPWRFSFDSATGALYIADVGQDEWEEIDFLPAGSPGGSNFGWNYFEGNHVYQGTPPDGAQFVSPVAEYSHASGGCSVTGGYVYRGQALPAWQGIYIYGDYCSGKVFGLLQSLDGSWENRELYSMPFNITSFGVNESGEIYLVDRNGGIYRLQSQ